MQEWAEPYNDGMPYDAMNHLGIARMALETADLEGDIVSLEKAGYTLYSDPIQPEGCSASYATCVSRTLTAQ